MLQKLIDFINQRIEAFGKAPLCNLIPEHGICIKGFYLPLCARCTGTFFWMPCYYLYILICCEKKQISLFFAYNFFIVGRSVFN